MKLSAALNLLKVFNHPDEVASFLSMEDLRGVRRKGASVNETCPLAVWLNRATGHDVEVGSWGVAMDKVSGVIVVTTQVVYEFIRAFDGGEYKEYWP